MVCDLVPITDENAKRVLDDRDWRPTHALAHHGQLTVLDLTRKMLDAMGSSLEPDVRVGDVDELVGASGAGLVAEPGNVNQVASALDAMLRDPERRTPNGRRARQAARRTASSEAVASQTLEAYRRAIESRDGSVRSIRSEHPQTR